MKNYMVPPSLLASEGRLFTNDHEVLAPHLINRTCGHVVTVTLTCLLLLPSATSASIRGPQLPQRTGPSVQGMCSSSKHRQEAALRSHQVSCCGEHSSGKGSGLPSWHLSVTVLQECYQPGSSQELWALLPQVFTGDFITKTWFIGSLPTWLTQTLTVTQTFP